VRHVFLIGFMGAGKSTVGRLLAEKLAMPFVDLDAAIERHAGVSIKQIFADSGEEGFRVAEASALKVACEAEPSVIACGGGIILRDANRVLMQGCGTVVYLSVSAQEAVARIGDTTDRPLLAGDAAVMANKILSARLALYRTAADRIVDTSGQTPDEVADRVVHALTGLSVLNVDVHAGSGYAVKLGAGVLSGVGEVVRGSTGAQTVAMVTDENVNALFGDVVEASIVRSGARCHRFVVPAGESSKSWTSAGALLEEFARTDLGRRSAVVAVGGGVVGDLAGFCAATYMRGIRLVHVATTLLAQVDSSIGGKTGVDLAAGKNLAGAFWQPSAVISDTDVLRSLPESEWQNGLVEIVKTALLQGSQHVAWLESEAAALIARDDRAVLETVESCVRFKSAVVSDDERESGTRECLNLGHTLGHAIEKVAGYGSVSHGMAVAEGLRFAAMLAEKVIAAPAAELARVDSLLRAFSVPRVKAAPEVSALLQAMVVDKKNRDGQIRFVLLRSPGAWEVVPVEEDVIRATLEEWASRSGEESS